MRDQKVIKMPSKIDVVISVEKIMLVVSRNKMIHAEPWPRTLFGGVKKFRDFKGRNGGLVYTLDWKGRRIICWKASKS